MMKKRFMRYILYRFIKYIPGTSTIAVLEAQRLTNYITSNFDLGQQTIILEEIKQNLTTHRESQIVDQKQNIIDQQKYLVKLEVNHLRLIA